MPKHIYYTTILPLYICIMIIYDCFKSFHMNNTPEDNSGVPAPRKRCILDHPILRGHWLAWRRSGQHWTCGTAAPMHQNWMGERIDIMCGWCWTKSDIIPDWIFGEEMCLCFIWCERHDLRIWHYCHIGSSSVWILPKLVPRPKVVVRNHKHKHCKMVTLLIWVPGHRGEEGWPNCSPAVGVVCFLKSGQCLHQHWVWGSKGKGIVGHWDCVCSKYKWLIDMKQELFMLLLYLELPTRMLL